MAYQEKNLCPSLTSWVWSLEHIWLKEKIDSWKMSSECIHIVAHAIPKEVCVYLTKWILNFYSSAIYLEAMLYVCITCQVSGKPLMAHMLIKKALNTTGHYMKEKSPTQGLVP